MAIVEWEKEEYVAVVRMNREDNKQNLEFATAMAETLDEILEDPEVRAVVLTSGHEKTWSVGVDIEWLGGRLGEEDYPAIKAFMYGMNDVFKKLLTYPVPVIAAIGGHAFGNGAMLACACDFRFMKADRGYFCFPEVDLGIPFLPGMIAFVRKAIPEQKFCEMKLTGKRVGAGELFEHGVVVKASENAEALMADAMAFARGFAKKRGIFGELKRRMYKEIIRVIDEEDPEYIEPLNLMVQE